VRAVMVKNHGFLPAGVGELARQRQEFQDILFSTWPACTQPTPASARPFLADCIIANPPAAGTPATCGPSGPGSHLLPVLSLLQNVLEGVCA
jgi:hypothetical protein